MCQHAEYNLDMAFLSVTSVRHVVVLCPKECTYHQFFFQRLIGLSFGFLKPIDNTKFKGEFPHRSVKYTGVGEIGVFRPTSTSSFMVETVRDRPMVTMDH